MWCHIRCVRRGWCQILVCILLMQNLNLQNIYAKMQKSYTQNANVKQLSKQEEELNDDEKQDVTALLIRDGCPVPEFVDSDENDSIVNCLKKRRMERAAELKKAKYTGARFVLSTANLLERFFSSAVFAYGEHRQSLLPVNLEMHLFLKCNQSLWNEETVSKIVNEPTQIDELVRNYFYISVMYQFASYFIIFE